MMTVSDAAFFVLLGATLVALCVKYDDHFRKLVVSRYTITGNKEKDTSHAPAFLESPTPLHTITPATLSSYAGERDHIYVNKVLRHPYHQTMAHQPMHHNDWIEIDSDYVRDLAHKAELINVQGKVVLDVVDDETVKLACQELMEHISEWITIRFPGLFRWRDEGRRDVLNLATNDVVPLYDQQSGLLKNGKEALYSISRLVQDDFLIASPLSDGHWLCAGGLVCFPGFYLLSDKINTTLFHTHVPVPQFNEKILASVERTLTRLEPSKPIERTSWEIVDSDSDQFWVPMAGPLPTTTGAKPTTPHHLTGRSPDACRTEDPSQLLLRLDHQTFTKMPKSGIVFFGVHPFRRRLEKLRHSAMLPRLLLDIHRDGPSDMMKYKAALEYQDSVLPFLQSLDEWQSDNGLINKDDRSVDFRTYQDRVSAPSQKAATAA
ncbi:hypothetical protein CBS101457_003430 [Exobasidium rhododendri]|nr:hypothetical protein CBS101457_003430 [Exobasidium rhododendri]